MRKSFLVLVAVILVTVFATAPVVAGVTYWDPLVGHKMHWPQLPDTTTLGLDVNSTTNTTWCCECVLADDWQCSETGFVKDIHFWGSWMGDTVGIIDAFDIRIYSNIPGPPFSMPGGLLWQYTVPFSYVHVHSSQTSTKKEGWYCPCCLLFAPANHKLYYQYNVTIPNEYLFTQEQGTVYWLSVRAIMHPGTQACWGWKTARRQDHFMDDAVYSCSGGPWVELRHPDDQVSLDLAFVITGNAQAWPETPSLSEIGIIILVFSLAVVGVLVIRRARRARLV